MYGGIANFIEQFEIIRDFIKYILQICKIRFTDFVKYDYPFPHRPANLPAAARLSRLNKLLSVGLDRMSAFGFWWPIGLERTRWGQSPAGAGESSPER